MIFYREYLNAIRAYYSLFEVLGIKVDYNSIDITEEEYTLFKLVHKIDLLKVDRYLDLCYAKVTTLPDNLTITNSLNIRGSMLTVLPNNLKIGLNLYLENTAIKSLPDSLDVGGYVYAGIDQLNNPGSTSYNVPDKFKDRIKHLREMYGDGIS